MAWIKAGSDTTTGADTAIRVSSMTASKFIQTMAHSISTSTALTEEARIDNISTLTYSQKHSINGGTNGTASGDSWQIHYYGTASGTYFTVGYMCNISGEEKLRIHHRIEAGTAGTGNAPHRLEFVGKQTSTTQLTDYQQFDDGGGSYYDTGSNLSVLGSDGVESINVQDGAVYYETDTNKSYVLSSNVWTEL